VEKTPWRFSIYGVTDDNWGEITGTGCLESYISNWWQLKYFLMFIPIWAR